MNSFKAANKVIKRLRENGHEALLAGGCVRDRLLGIEPKDHDVATSAPPGQVCALFRRTRKVGVQFGVVLVSMDGCDIEVATFRTDGDYLDGRRPEHVTFAGAEEDAERRDFTINGMFYDPLDDRVIDYVGGRADLDARLIRCIGDPQQRFSEDHLRLLRAVRFAARLDFAIEPQTFRAICSGAENIADISPERVRMELEAILSTAGRSRAWSLIVESGLVDHIVRDVVWSRAQSNRTQRLLAALPPTVSIPLGFAAMLCSLGEQHVRLACRNLRCSNAAADAVLFLTRSLPEMFSGTKPELADVKLLLASGLFEELCTLAKAVAKADGTDGGVVEALRRRGQQIPVDAIAPPPLLRGDDLLSMQLPPGPTYSKVLTEVYRAQLNEAIHTPEEALALARAILTQG